MSIRELSPRLASTEPRVPVFPNGRRPSWLVAVVVVFAALPVVIAIVDPRPGLRVVMAAIAIAILGGAVCLNVLFGTIRERTLRVDDAVDGVWFRPAPAATVIPFVLSALLLLPALAQIVVDTARLPSMESFLLARAPYALALVGIGVAVMKARQLREPAGLRVSSRGLIGIRGRGRVDWAWDDLASVDVGAGPVAKLTLTHRGDGPRVDAPMLALGSDPNQVATVVRYFRDHPSERTRLAEGGPAVIRSLDDVLRAREG